MSQPAELPLRLQAARVRETVRVPVEGELLDPSLGAWNAGFLRRARRPLGILRGRSRDRLDAAGEKFFERCLRPRLLHAGVERLRRARRAGHLVVLESDGSEHVLRPLARHLAADRFTARRFEFRDGIATGRTLPGVTETDTHREPPRPAVILTEKAGAPPPLSVRGALAGREILLVGVTGFIGKVWLAGLLENVPEIGRVHLLLRRRGARSPEERALRMFRESPVFDRFRRRAGRSLDQRVAERIRVHEGDVTRPDLGLDPAARHELRGSLDLVVNSAGLTEFNPDPRDALAINADGVIHVLDFVQQCDDAALLHLSTCFVAGRREGRIPESIDPYRTPSGAAFHPEEERRALRRMAGEPGGNGRSGSRRARAARRPVVEAVVERARELGWPNIYTYTKALGEALIALRAEGGSSPRCTVVRPSIVESAVEFPFRGWNEGVNTSAPLSHLLGTYFRQLPVNQRKRLDVIPVDLLCRGLTLAAAALAENRHDPVVHLATSAVNPLDLRRAVELTSLAHQKHHRSRPGWRSRVLARLEAVPVSRERYGRLSVPAQLRAVRALRAALVRIGGGPRALARAERTLQRVKELIDLYEPFLLENEPVFEAAHVERLAAAVPADERERFGYDPRTFGWYDYWINVHIPGLRRWSYPLIEGRPVDFESPAAGPAATSAEDGHPVVAPTGDR